MNNKPFIKFKQLYKLVHGDKKSRVPNFLEFNTTEYPLEHKVSPLKEQSLNHTDSNYTQRYKGERIPSAKISLPMHKQLDSEAVKYFGDCIKKIKREIEAILEKRTKSERESLSKEFKIIANLFKLIKKEKEKIGLLFNDFEENISKVLEYKLTRVIFYFIYSKYLECVSDEISMKRELKFLRACDKDGRILGIFSLSLYCCQRILKILICLKNFEEAQEFGRKAIRLAVLLKNDNEEYRIIEFLKLLNFYIGSPFGSEACYLSKCEKNYINKCFDPLDDVEFEKEESSKVAKIEKKTKYNVERISFEDEKKISSNIESFISNLAFMNKDLTERSKNVMSTVKKVGKVGYVNKYLKNGSSICLQPRSSEAPLQNRGQILLTHCQKKIEVECLSKFLRFYLPSCEGMIENFCDFERSL